MARGRDSAFLHGLEKGCLRLGGCPVDFVGEDDVGKQWPLYKFELPRLIENFRTDNVARHQVWGELDAIEAQTEGLGDGVDEKGLARPGTPTSKMCPPAKNRGSDLSDHLILAYDDFANFGEKGFMLERSASSVICRQKIRHGQVT